MKELCHLRIMTHKFASLQNGHAVYISSLNINIKMRSLAQTSAQYDEETYSGVTWLWRAQASDVA